jgi:hypothetical protein
MKENLISFPFDFERLKKWHRLENHVPKDKASDCVINCLFFLKIIDEETAIALAKKANAGTPSHLYNPDEKEYILVKGLQRSIITDNIISDYIQKKIFEQNRNEFNNTTKKSILIKNVKLENSNNYKIINDDLKNGEATLIRFGRKEGNGHICIAFKHGDLIHFFDPQQELIILNNMITYHEMISLFKELNVSTEKDVENEVTNNEEEEEEEEDKTINFYFMLFEKYQKKNNLNIEMSHYSDIEYSKDFVEYEVYYLFENNKRIRGELFFSKYKIRKSHSESKKTKKRIKKETTPEIKIAKTKVNKIITRSPVKKTKRTKKIQKNKIVKTIDIFGIGNDKDKMDVV